MILTDERLLRRPCVDVLPQEVNDIRVQLEAELKESGLSGRPGIGLAAPQIGILKNMAIVRIPHKGGIHSLDLVNCTITQGYDLAFFDGEGCLSFPDQHARTRRFQEIYVTNNLVYPYSFIATGLIAVVCQHELDHLHGILLPDLV